MLFLPGIPPLRVRVCELSAKTHNISTCMDSRCGRAHAILKKKQDLFDKPGNGDGLSRECVLSRADLLPRIDNSTIARPRPLAGSRVHASDRAFLSSVKQPDATFPMCAVLIVHVRESFIASVAGMRAHKFLDCVHVAAGCTFSVVHTLSRQWQWQWQ